VNLVLLSPAELDLESRVVLRDARATHLLRVLKVSEGSLVRVGVIDGPVGHAEVEHVGPAAVTLRCELGETPPRPRIDLLLALPRPKVLGRLYASLAQLGVGRLILTNASRVERFYFDAHQLEPAFQRAQLLEGLAQARDTRVPSVSAHRSFRALVEDDLEDLAPQRRRVLADPGAHPTPRAALGALDAAERVLLAIGPEGGWSDFERDLLRAQGFAPVSMGARTLRTDVATIALLALMHDALADRRA
jgi:16S rRNA (uracil1498-N3)-methyltransferase